MKRWRHHHHYVIINAVPIASMLHVPWLVHRPSANQIFSFSSNSHLCRHFGFFIMRSVATFSPAWLLLSTLRLTHAVVHHPLTLSSRGPPSSPSKSNFSRLRPCENILRHLKATQCSRKIIEKISSPLLLAPIEILFCWNSFKMLFVFFSPGDREWSNR